MKVKFFMKACCCVLLLPIYCFSQIADLQQPKQDLWFNKLTVEERFNKENINKLVEAPLNPVSDSFKFLTLNRKKINQIMGSDIFVEQYIALAVRDQYIQPLLWKDKKKGETAVQNPEWQKIAKKIPGDLPADIAGRALQEAKIEWYTLGNDTVNQIKSIVAKIDKYGLNLEGWNRMNANNVNFDLIFFHSNDKKILKKAIKWQEQIIATDRQPSEGHYDTYANLLYKLGKKKSAIAWQTKAVELDRQNAAKYNRAMEPIFAETLNKMKLNQKTW